MSQCQNAKSVNSSQKSNSSHHPELIDLTQDDFLDLTSDHSSVECVSHISETEMADSSCKSEKTGIYFPIIFVNLKSLIYFEMLKNLHT